MGNYQTLKNCLGKLEAKQKAKSQRQYCGVISIEDYENLELPEMEDTGSNTKVGYLVVPRRLTEGEWEPA